ncbi:MAG: GH3 auxin-responsive promoter family protein [Bacteroidota bacterium]
MALKSKLVKPFARIISSKIDREARKAVKIQESLRQKLVHQASNTLFGKDHWFSEIRTYKDFKSNVPVRDYEGLKPYITKIVEGQPDILWKGRPAYLAKTSGTTSGVKYIPISKESAPHHVGTARNMVFHHIAKTGHSDWMDGKMIFLSGSPELTQTNGIATGRLSGIVNHLIPGWLKSNRLPSYETNCIEDWETKLDHIIDETIDQNMTMISGIPPWVQMYYERLLDRSGKSNILELFPNYSLFVYGGVNFEPYRAKLEELVGASIKSLETYPASEGFIAFQDRLDDPGLLLNVNVGIFYEFVPVDEIFSENPTRLSLGEVELGTNYALIINSNSGLWGYNIGDTVKFVSTDPYRLVVTGRVKHFISAFGEHVIGKEVEEAMLDVAKAENIRIVEFTVAPQVNPPDGSTPYHEWFVEFDNLPENMTEFAKKVDLKMTEQNIYYLDLIEGNILQPLKIRPMQPNAFRNYMKTQGKLGGQNKVPRLSNDRKIADQLEPYTIK